MQSKVTLTFREKELIKRAFIKQLPGWLEGVESYKNVLKKGGLKRGGCGPLSPSPKSAYD